MRETDHQKNQGHLALSLTEATLSMVLLVIIVAGAALGTGFYLGTRSTQTAEVVELCADLSRANEDRVQAIKVNYDIMHNRVQKYEEFLLDTGLTPTLPLATSSSADNHRTRKKHRLGRGGS